jgi:hypothetical protein
MKRNETPSYASIILDEICRPINPTGSHSLLAASIQRLWEKLSCKTNTTLLNHFIPVQKSLSGYNYLIKNTIVLKDYGLIKPIN